MLEFPGEVSPQRNPVLLGRYIALGIGLLAEYLLLSFCFDAQPVVARGGTWVAFSEMGTAGLVAALIGLAAVLLRFISKASVGLTAPRVSIRLLTIHAVAYASFFGLTWLTLGCAQPPPGPAIVWIGVWFSAGISSVGTLVAGLLGFHIKRPRLLLELGASACLVGIIAWKAGQLSQWLWGPLSHATLVVTATLLRMAFPIGVRGPDGVILGLSDFAVRIDPVCSGFEGMGLAAALTLAYWFAFRRDLRFPNAYLLLPICVTLAWLGNIVRIIALMILGAFINPNLAVGAFHSKAGWVLFCAIILVVGHLGRRARFFSRIAPQADEPSDNPTAAYVTPLVVWVATALVTGLFAISHDRMYGVRILAAAVALYACRRYYRELNWGWSWTPYVLGALTALVWLAVPGPKATSLQIEAAGQNASAGWLLTRVLGSMAIVPLCEELAFRGFLLRWFVSRDFTRVSLKLVAPFAILVSSLAFGLLHQRWLVASLAGALYATAQIRGGRVWDAVIAHGVSNAIIAAWVLCTGDFSQWS